MLAGDIYFQKENISFAKSMRSFLAGVWINELVGGSGVVEQIICVLQLPKTNSEWGGKRSNFEGLLLFLVGGFDPSETYEWNWINWIISPGRGWKKTPLVTFERQFSSRPNSTNCRGKRICFFISPLVGIFIEKQTGLCVANHSGPKTSMSCTKGTNSGEKKAISGWVVSIQVGGIDFPWWRRYKSISPLA